MVGYELSKGKGRVKVDFRANYLGDDLVVFIYNENAHIGAVAVGEYDHKEARASVSVITRLGHKDDAVAQKAAYLLSKATKKTTCVVAGIHLEGITKDEIDKILDNAERVVEEFLLTAQEG